MTQSTYEFAVPLPITQSAHRTATHFASQQPTPAKAEQVRLNTLAVLVVKDYFELMEIPAQPEVGDSWNVLMRMCTDVADLDVAGVGRLECRPVRPDAETCAIPAETWEDRIGYAVVQIDESAREAQLLGFVPTAATESLPLSQLRSPEDLLDHLYELKIAATAPSAAQASVATVERVFTNLGNWLQDTVEQGWQTVESLLLPAQSSAFAFRNRDRSSTIRRAKSIDLRPQLNQAIALVVSLQPETDAHITIYLQLQPTTEAPLPENIQLAILDDAHEIVEVGHADTTLQVDGNSGERFYVQITLNDSCAIEEFVI